MSAGATIVGFSISFTVTVKLHSAFPQLFAAVSVTVVIPLLNTEPLPVPLPVPLVAPVNI